MIRFIGQVYHSSLLICYPYLFYFYALMLVALWECKLPPLNDTGKESKPMKDFEKILTLTLAKGFDLYLSLGETIPLITPFMDINWPCIFGRVRLDMLKDLGIWSDFFQVQDDLIGPTLVDPINQCQSATRIKAWK